MQQTGSRKRRRARGLLGRSRSSGTLREESLQQSRVLPNVFLFTKGIDAVLTEHIAREGNTSVLKSTQRSDHSVPSRTEDQVPSPRRGVESGSTRDLADPKTRKRGADVDLAQFGADVGQLAGENHQIAHL